MIEDRAIVYMRLDQGFPLFCLAVATISDALKESRRASIDKFLLGLLQLILIRLGSEIGGLLGPQCSLQAIVLIVVVYEN